jgi:hypothetical protein
MPVSLIVQFVDLAGSKPFTVGNWTSYTIKKDFFIPADEFTLVLEDDRAPQLFPLIKQGQKVILSINDETIMIGYIDLIDPEYTRGGGMKLTLRGRDYLGVLNDSSIFPNLNTGTTTTFQFPPSTTLTKACNLIIFNSQAQLSPITFVFYPGQTQDQSTQLTFKSGFGAGVKTPRGNLVTKNVNTTPLAHLLSPEKGESYLGYITRIIKRAGLNIKMFYGENLNWDGQENIVIEVPTYNFQQSKSSSSYGVSEDSTPQLVHSYDDTVTNVLSGKPHLNFKEQPSVLVFESYAGGPTFRKEQFKVIAINELTGYLPNQNAYSLSLSNAVPNVQQAIQQLTNGKITNNISGSSIGGTGYYLLPPNQQLYNVIPQAVLGIQTAYARPKYIVDVNSHTKEELVFTAYKTLAEYQNKFFNLEYEVAGHTYGPKHKLWNINTLVLVQDDIFKIYSTMYLHGVQYTKSRHGGTTTKLELHLPYIHSFFSYSDQSKFQNPAPPQTKFYSSSASANGQQLKSNPWTNQQQ